eukprot:354246-Alexandrium_andersonii.AAC.1
MPPPSDFLRRSWATESQIDARIEGVAPATELADRRRALSRTNCTSKAARACNIERRSRK